MAGVSPAVSLIAAHGTAAAKATEQQQQQQQQQQQVQSRRSLRPRQPSSSSALPHLAHPRMVPAAGVLAFAFFATALAAWRAHSAKLQVYQPLPHADGDGYDGFDDGMAPGNSGGDAIGVELFDSRSLDEGDRAFGISASWTLGGGGTEAAPMLGSITHAPASAGAGAAPTAGQYGAHGVTRGAAGSAMLSPAFSESTASSSALNFAMDTAGDDEDFEVDGLDPPPAPVRTGGHQRTSMVSSQQVQYAFALDGDDGEVL